MILRKEQIEKSNQDDLSKHKKRFAFISGGINNVDNIIQKLIDFQVAIPSWALGTGGTRFGRFPGGGSTVRFVREAGWGNAMRYMLTGDHWGAEEAYRMGMLQHVAETPEAALSRAVEIARQVAACAPLGVQTTLASAHLAIDGPEAEAFSKLGAQYSGLYRTQDFIEGVRAQAEGRPPVFHGN